MEQVSARQATTEKPKLIVIGNGMVGHNFIEQLQEQGAAAHYQILVFGEEAYPAYDRVQLSSYFQHDPQTPMQEKIDALLMADPQDYAAHQVHLSLQQRISQVVPQEKYVISEDGQRWDYDKLVFATGSYGFVPPINGHDRPNCLVYRTIDDLQAIEAAANQGKVGVVIGGGLLGLEAANALLKLGLQTHVVEFAPQLMPVQLDPTAGKLLAEKIEALGVQVHCSKATEAIIDGEECQQRMVFSDGEILETDLIVFSAGIRPYDQLGRDAQLTMGQRGGIAVNDYCQTSDSHIYAIGECASWQEKIFGLVAPGYQMARVVADQLLSDARNQIPTQLFQGADMSTKLKLLGIDVAAIGDSRGTNATQGVELIDNQQGIYKKLWLNDKGDQLLGALLVGDTNDYSRLLDCYLSKEQLTTPAVGLLFAEETSASDLKDTAIICSCHQVDKQGIVQAVCEGAHSLADIKQCTKAASGCGGCAPLVSDIIDQTLEAQGIATDKGVCQHFEYSRQELFHLCQVEQIQDFPTLIDKHGRAEHKGHGLGCEICKPMAASIFASLDNRYILEQDLVPLQDTNDAYLGNLQKDGSYSVVPRVAGGEITPQQLIAVGMIAEKYDLYTKITGGQRIDLFGAALSQLPQIWQELIDAGFETGHAYGKSLRTVKSCVGSTWCRYGVQDSVSMAILLENRYKGLRAPHKIKMAVSGCTRECAEAQSKDIGVIATDKGWNLYVCGNGGMRPRHADLFATDLDDQQLLAAIDKLLIFYCSTGDRLQRTAPWLESLEGGLDYLKQVILEDSLGIGADLIAQMDKVRESYQCEWKTSLEKPEFLERFQEFINPEMQPIEVSHEGVAVNQLEYQRVRGQKMPKTKTLISDQSIEVVMLDEEEKV